MRTASPVSLGIACVLIANLGFTLTDASAKWLVLAGYSAIQLAFVRYITHFGITLGQSVWKRGFHHNPFACQDLHWVILRGSLLAFSTVLNFIALKFLSPTVTSTIMFSAPLIVALLSWPILGEAVSRVRWLAITLGFFGILITTRPFGEDAHWAVFLSLAAASMLALYSILTRKLSGRVSTDTMQFYLGVIGTLMYLPFVFNAWSPPETGWHWFFILCLGPFAWGGHQLLTWAHSQAPANLLMPFSYSYVVYMSIAGLVIFQIAPDFWTFVGTSIVVTASLIIWQHVKNSTQP